MEILNFFLNIILIQSTIYSLCINLIYKLNVIVKKHKPDFTISYNPDYRQKIADTWPNSIDDSRARADWNWKHQYDLAAMVQDILEQLPVYHNL